MTLLPKSNRDRLPAPLRVGGSTIAIAMLAIDCLLVGIGESLLVIF
jgi:hypothetical protein